MVELTEKPTKIDTDRPVVHRKIRHCDIELVVIEEWEKVGKRGGGFGRVEIFYKRSATHGKAENFSGAVNHVGARGVPLLIFNFRSSKYKYTL
jgi:hypothetical protein